MVRGVLSRVSAAVVLGVVACSGSATIDDHGGGGSGATGTGSAGAGGVDCSCAVGAYVPVCGVDGNTYDAACGIECVPVEVACEGPCPCVDCDDLEAQYQAALADARACSPMLDVEQCTESADDGLPCPCPTFINPANSEAKSRLAELEELWWSHDCGYGYDCVEQECPSPGYATCDPVGGSGDTGVCTDQFGESGNP